MNTKERYNLSQYDIDHAIKLESFLIKELQIDVNNSEHSIRMLRKNNVMKVLNRFIYPMFEEILYDEIIFPAWVEIEWSNNFVSLSSMLEYLEPLELFANEQELLECIWQGKEMLKLLQDNRL